jgi:hypothetical protein
MPGPFSLTFPKQNALGTRLHEQILVNQCSIKPNITDVLLHKKAWCDVTTDGGGYLLVAKKDDPVTWTVPSSNETVYPQGTPHWSSIFGDMNMLDIRIQISTTSRFEDTKADW